jgi:hypothetical protein
MDPIKLVDVIIDDVGIPRNDGSKGSALYAVPFRLSRVPPPSWTRFFLKTWNSPPRFTSMHRPGIARVEGDRVVLDGTTIEEVQRFHLETLKLAVAEANKMMFEQEKNSERRASAEEQRKLRHREHVSEVAKQLKFND